mgnify:CR=1 FL=1
MNEEILINFSPMETRVAVIENGMLQEVHVERNDHLGIVGNIYLGKIVPDATETTGCDKCHALDPTCTQVLASFL